MRKIKSTWRAGLGALGLCTGALLAQGLPQVQPVQPSPSSQSQALPSQTQASLPPATRTVQELIQTLKAQRQLQLDPQKQSAKEGSARPVSPGRSAMPPLLWSLSGLNQRYTAVMVIERRVHVIQSQSLPMSVGGWRVRAMDEDGVSLSRGARTLNLPAPHAGSTTDAFLKALPQERRQGAGDGAAEATPSERSGLTGAMNPSEAGGPTPQLSTPLPAMESAATAIEALAPGASKEKR